MDNLRASVLMTVAMAFFAFEDMLIKLLSARVPTGQMLLIVGVSGMAIFAAWIMALGQGLHLRHVLHPKVMARNLCEGICAVTFVTALTIGDLSIASAILQALPLLMTLGAALFLGEPVGWRRWLSIAIGFLGVLLIVRPGTDAFQTGSVLALIAVLALAVRDLLTRHLPAHISSGLLSGSAFGAMALAGLVLLAVQSQTMIMPVPLDAGLIAVALACGMGGYITMVIATRIASIATIAPFRYSRLIFALALGVTVFGERPDTLTLSGAAVIAGAGIYTMWREARLGRRIASLPLAATPLAPAASGRTGP